MYSRPIFAAVPAIALVLVTCANRSIASPALVVRDRHHSMMQNGTSTAHGAEKNATMPRRTRTKHTVQAVRRSLDDALGTASLDGYLSDLTLDHDQILTTSNAFSSTAQRARSNSDDSSRQATAAGLANFQSSLGPLYPLLSKVGADKGLANYDKSDQYETLLKDIVNANKDVLGDSSDLINADPLLGPLLGPIVYDIKCILDELLDYTENATDATLNALSPLLKPIIQNATGTVCRSIVPPVAGLCLQV